MIKRKGGPWKRFKRAVVLRERLCKMKKELFSFFFLFRNYEDGQCSSGCGVRYRTLSPGEQVRADNDRSFVGAE